MNSALTLIPKRQEVVKQELHQLSPVNDLEKEESANAAKLSVLHDPKVVDHLLKIWGKKDPEVVKKFNPVSLQLVQLSAVRGFTGMISALGKEYAEFLKSNGLEQDLFNQLADTASKISIQK